MPIIQIPDSYTELLIHSDNSNAKTHYTYYGRNKLKVLFYEIGISIKRYIRKKYIDENLLKQIQKLFGFSVLTVCQKKVIYIGSIKMVKNYLK